MVSLHNSGRHGTGPLGQGRHGTGPLQGRRVTGALGTGPLGSDRFPEERRLATVLFADLVDFSILAEGLDFEVVSDISKAIWHGLDKVILDFGGYIDKHMGDGVMAVWGAPFGDEEDAEKAVSAALALQQTFGHYVSHSDNPVLSGMQMRIGINTGMVLAGYVGLVEEYTMMGKTVNIARRLEEQAQPSSILISDSTFRAVRGAFRVRRRDLLSVKGQSSPIQTYNVVEKMVQLTRLRYRGSAGVKTEMVARGPEMERLRELYNRSQNAKSPIMTIVIGEAGIGKSRLLMEFTESLELEENGLNLFSVRGLNQMKKVPFFLWKSMWQNRFELTEDIKSEETRKKFLRGIQELWGKELSTVPSIEVAHLIGDMIDLKWPNSRYLDALENSPVLRYQRSFELTRELLRRVSMTGPTVLMIDDLQSVDKLSLDLLADLLKPGKKSLPMLILCGARPDLFREKIRWANYAEIVPLKQVKFDAALVREAYPRLQQFPKALLAELAGRADGNPYYLEEMVKTLLGGKGDPTDSSMVMMRTEDIFSNLPTSLQSLLQARLDSLSREARTVALLASMVGRVFWVGAIAAAAKQPTSTGILDLPPGVLERVIQNSLRELMSAELAFPRAGSIFSGEKEYIFKHALLRNVAYGLLPIKYRKQYHKAIGLWLANRAGPDFQVMVADHFESAGERVMAIRHYRRAAAYAQGRGAIEETQWLLARIDGLSSQHEYY